MKKFETTSMENLEMRYDMRGDGKTVRFQDYVVVAHSAYIVQLRQKMRLALVL